MSKSGSPFGPWALSADYHKLAASGSALTDPGYMPGVQAWYNQFLQVDPTDPDHVYLGLEEVFESADGGATWQHTRAVLELRFPLLETSTRPSRPVTVRQTTHPDQHAVAIGAFKRQEVRGGRQRWRHLPPAVARRRGRRRARPRLDIAQRRIDGRPAVLLRRHRAATVTELP